MKRIILCAMVFGLISGVQTAKADRAVRIPVEADDKDQAFEVPTALPGETLTVYVDLPADDEEMPDKIITTTPTTITNLGDTIVNEGGNVDMRFGLNLGGMFPGHPSAVASGGLNFEIGHTDSMWRLQAALGAGNCQGSSHNGDGVAINSGIGLMYSVAKHLRVGPGVDLLYCSDVSSHPMEKANERLVGTSFRAELTKGYFSFNLSVGLGVDTVPVPGDRTYSLVPYAMTNIVLWTSDK